MAYYWPSLVNIDKDYKPDFNIMVFSHSKSLGIAGSRLGHALIKDKQMAEQMASYISNTSIHISNDALYRGIIKMRHVKQNPLYFQWVKIKMAYRWEKINQWA